MSLLSSEAGSVGGIASRVLSTHARTALIARGVGAELADETRVVVRLLVFLVRFNALGPEGLIDNWTQGPKPRLSTEQLAEVAQIVEAGPDRGKDGVVRWRRIDLKRVIAERFGVEFHERYVGKLLKTLGFSHIREIREDLTGRPLPASAVPV